LHIFEERYRNLIEDTLRKPDDQHCFAVGSVVEAGIGEPPISPHAGVGRITEYSRTPDGRYMLVLKGVGRVELQAELPEVNGYRVFSMEWRPDVRPLGAMQMERHLASELRALALALLREHAEKFRSLLSEDVELGALSDMLCGYLPFEPEFKLQQMAARNVIERAAATIALLERMTGHGPEKPVRMDDPPPVN